MLIDQAEDAADHDHPPLGGAPGGQLALPGPQGAYVAGELAGEKIRRVLPPDPQHREVGEIGDEVVSGLAGLVPRGTRLSHHGAPSFRRMCCP